MPAPHRTAPGGRRWPVRSLLSLALGLVLTAPVPVPAQDRSQASSPPRVQAPTGSVADRDDEGSGPWTVVRRSIDRVEADGQGTTWVIETVLRLDTATPLVLRPEQVRAEVDGWVSNSRVRSHAAPRRLAHVVDAVPGHASVAPLVTSRDPARRCGERATLQVGPGPESARALACRLALGALGAPPWVVRPGAELSVRLSLEHEHFLYGPYEPLLGERSLTLRLGPAVVRDRLALEAGPDGPPRVPAWPAFVPPADRRDGSLYVSPPDSLHLQADVPGHGLFRLSGPVRYSTRMTLRYRYLIAPGSQGELHERISQYRQGQPATWKALHDGDQDRALPVVGQWVAVEQTLTTEPEATWLSIEFRLGGPIGEAWIDDLTLEPSAGALAP